MSMSQVMAFTQRIEFKTLLEIECKGLTGFSPVIHQKLEDFVSMLSLLDSVDILIIDEPKDQATFKSLLVGIKLRREEIKKIFFLSNHKVDLTDVKVFALNDVEELLSEIKTLIAPPVASNQGYISIPTDSLIHFKVLPFDLYVKISDDKYLKRIPAHEEIDESTFASFLSRGINDLYYERKYNRDFSLMLINNMINRVEQDYGSIAQKLTATNEVFVTTQQIVEKLGFKPKVIEVCESVLNQISEDVSSGKDSFAKFLEQLRTQVELTFHYRLMELTSFVATQIIDEMEKEGKRERIKKVIFASMFCDYTLMENSQIHIRSADQVSKLLLTEQKIINEHALKASELINQYRNAPYEASLIIKQHHGSMSGVGLPTEISAKILPLSKCLMTAQEVAYQILMESARHPIDVLSDIKLKFIDTPLEDFFVLFEKTCQDNLKD
ncbi:MAG: hypothetical protein H0V66_09585 [Bdellovibrionales bacterium]|nr:hypothetical protein [Bdellovibrionales bacterium]